MSELRIKYAPGTKVLISATVVGCTVSNGGKITYKCTLPGYPTKCFEFREKEITMEAMEKEDI